MIKKRDAVILNANVRTVDDHDSVARAVLVRAGKFAAVGPEAEVRAAASAAAELIDVGGRTVVPGFIDDHNHLSIAAFAPDCVDCSTPPLSTLREVLETIANHCKTVPAGQWVRGMGFHMLSIREQRNPTRYELDEVAPNNPFFLISSAARKWMSAATSSGFPRRPATEAVSMRAISASAFSCWRSMGVSMKPGHTQFTRIRIGDRSIADVWVRLITAAFDAA